MSPEKSEDSQPEGAATDASAAQLKAKGNDLVKKADFAAVRRPGENRMERERERAGRGGGGEGIPFP